MQEQGGWGKVRTTILLGAVFLALVLYLNARYNWVEVIDLGVNEIEEGGGGSPTQPILMAEPGPPVRQTERFHGTELRLCGTESYSLSPIESYIWRIDGQALPATSLASITHDFSSAGEYDVSLQITNPGITFSGVVNITYHIFSDSDIEGFLLDYEGSNSLQQFQDQAGTDPKLWSQSFKTIGQMMELYEGDSSIGRLQTTAEFSLPHGTDGDLLLRYDPQPNNTVVILANGESSKWFDMYSINQDGSLTLRGEYNFGLRQDAFSIAEAPNDRVVIAGRNGIDVIDISDLDRPTHLGRWNSPKGDQARTEHLVFAVDVVESGSSAYAFVTVRRRTLNDNDPIPYNEDATDTGYNVTGVHVLNITNPSQIIHVGAQGYIDVPGTESYVYRDKARYAGRHIVVDESENQVVVANGDSGVHVFKYDPFTFLLNETEKWGYDVGENPDPKKGVRHYASELHVQGNYVFVAAGKNGLVSLERKQNPDRLTELDSLAGEGLHGLSIDTIPGESILLLGILRSCDADSDTVNCKYPEQGGLRAIDTSSPGNLLLDSAFEIDFPLVGRASGAVSVLYNNTHSDKRVYVESDWHAGFLYDIDLTAIPSQISKNEIHPVSGEIQSLYVRGNHAYVGDSSFVATVDISNPYSPSFVDFFYTEHQQFFGKLEGWSTNLYLQQKNQISVSDISNDNGILTLEELELLDEHGIMLPPPYEVFCIDDDRFWVFTRSPSKISVYNLVGAPYDKPSHIATGPVPPDYDFGTQYNHVACEAERFYMLTNKAQGRSNMIYGLIAAELQGTGLKVHFKSGDDLKLLQDQRVSLAVDGNSLYTNNGLRGNIPNLGCENRRSRGLIVIDVADPNNPFVRQRLDSHLWSNTGLHIDRDGDVLYAQSYTGFDSGVKVFDVADPNSPNIVAAEDINVLNTVNTGYNSRGWLPGIKRGDFLYSAKLAKLEVFDLNPECSPCPHSYCREGLMCTISEACTSGCCEYSCSRDVNCAATDPIPQNACACASCTPNYCLATGKRCWHDGSCGTGGCCNYLCNPDSSCFDADPIQPLACQQGDQQSKERVSQ